MGHVQERGRVAGQYRDQQVNEMTAVKVLSKVFKNAGYQVFALAILASLLWHLFWLSTISIVSSPENSRPIKFSKVSFLGPLLGKGTMELQARPKERSFLEKRYLVAVDALQRRPESGVDLTIDKYETGNNAYHLRDEGLTAAIDDALSGEKLEPSYEEE